MSRKPFRVTTIYDTETTNIGFGEETRAFPCLYIFNDVKDINLYEYEPDHESETISFIREESATIEYLEDVIMWGRFNKVVPVVCVYNLIFDLKPIIKQLNDRYPLQTMAQSSTHIYTLDICDENGNILLRFWDTFFLEMRGLDAMGKTCGVAKATGSWDYDKVRTPYTPLSEEELYYAKRDVQVIPAYLRFILESNEWADPFMFADSILTKTSLVRQMAKFDIGRLKVEDEKGKKHSLSSYFMSTCNKEKALDYQTYALRKACFRGGFTFTAARQANRIVENVVSLDVTSMHHTFINGRFIPVHFQSSSKEELENAAWSIIETTREYVLSHYEKPFLFGIHAIFDISNIRLKEDTIFSRDHIALLARSKFDTGKAAGAFGDNELNIEAERMVKASGFHDKAIGATFAFGKLYAAERAQVFMSELELWAFSQVYDFDEIEPLFGEISVNFRRPPDYVIGQSHVLYSSKDAMKEILNNYEEGQRYTQEIPSSVPEELAKQIKTGTISKAFLDGYYNSTVKGMFNGIFGAQAMDELRPDYMVEDGELYIDPETRTTPENFEERAPRESKVLYTYGMRIVGGSRMHLVIALQLLYEHFGNRMFITGGDTDSIKAACAKDVETLEISEALRPLEVCSAQAIERTSQRWEESFVELSCDMFGVGGFDVEPATKTNTFYPLHFEAWNKARISFDDNNEAHITAAGIARPAGSMNVERLTTDLSNEYGFEEIAPLVLGYNTNIDSSISYLLQRHTPKAGDRFIGDVTDHLGDTYSLNVPQSIALYPTSREVAGIEKRDNKDNIKYLQENFGVVIDTRIKILSKNNEEPHITIYDPEGVFEL